MTTEQYSIGYDAGYQDGFDAALAEPVKQEPVAWMNAERNTITWYELYPNMTPLYAAPVDVKAIREALANARAEALEEAAKVCDDESRYSNYADCCAAAIRNLK